MEDNKSVLALSQDSSLGPKGFIFLILDPPYSTVLYYERLKIIEHFLQTGKEMILFLYIDGIHHVNTSQSPKNFPNLEKRYRFLLDHYQNLRIVACSRCASARGYVNLSSLERWKSDNREKLSSDKIIENVQIVSIYSLGEFIKQGYRCMKL